MARLIMIIGITSFLIIVSMNVLNAGKRAIKQYQAKIEQVYTVY